MKKYTLEQRSTYSPFEPWMMVYIPGYKISHESKEQAEKALALIRKKYSKGVEYRISEV